VEVLVFTLFSVLSFRVTENFVLQLLLTYVGIIGRRKVNKESPIEYLDNMNLCRNE